MTEPHDDLPQLKPWLRWLAADDQVVVEYGHAVHVLGGSARAVSLLTRLLPLLDGTRTPAELAAEAAAESWEVAGLLRRLADLDLLLAGDPVGDKVDGTEATARFHAAADRTLGVAGARTALAAGGATVVGRGAAAERVVELLLASGLGAAVRGEWDATPPAFAVVAPAPEELAEVAGWNERAVSAGGPAWLQVLPFDGRFAAVGPLYVPGETCCYACFRHRRAAASGYGAELLALEQVPLRADSSVALDALAAAVATTVALRWLLHRDPAQPGVMYACERGGLGVTEHRLFRVPRCAVCSPTAHAAPPLPWFKEVGFKEVGFNEGGLEETGAESPVEALA